MTYKGSIDIEGHSGDMYTDLFVIGIYPKELGDPLQYQILQVTATKEKPMHFELQFKATLQPDDYRFIVANHNGTEIAQLLSIAPPREKRTSVSAMAERWHVPTFTTAEDNGFSLPTSLKARTETTVLPPDSCTMESTCCVS